MAHSAAIEAWLASSKFEEAMQTAYTMARGGSGSYDRNVSPEILEQVVVALHQKIEGGLALPRPDREFINTGENTHSAWSYRVQRGVFPSQTTCTDPTAM